MATKKKHQKAKPPQAIVNRRARFDYDLSDDIVVGLELTGVEVRAARDNHIQLKGAFVSVRGNELWLNNASFSLRLNERGKTGATTVDTRSRRLLAKRREIDELIARKQSGMTIVPTKLLTAGRYIKLVIALGKGKKLYDKRQTIKSRDIEREHKTALKYR
ncbi:SsrA-binding protein SmpB [Candidatus Saccharibacteria bacterium]|jgi:SsrA-binding protein|nr:SsrA-binding protein SmpB [Candidatus Saccharibacteria bacterium]